MKVHTELLLSFAFDELKEVTINIKLLILKRFLAPQL